MNRNGDWDYYPLPGETGEAFMGIRKDEKLFFKRNVSPIITAISAMGITPRLMWTQSTYTGDTLTAQEWLNGETYQPEDMMDQDLIDIIRMIHTSDSLLSIIRRIEGPIMLPMNIIDKYYENLPEKLAHHTYFNKIIQDLENRIDQNFYQVDLRLCHGDLNHNNFLYDNEENKLYLVDWEKACIADPIYDITKLLTLYYPPSQWSEWLALYGLEIKPSTYRRIHWYAIINCLLIIKQYYMEDRDYKMNEFILLLKAIYDNY